MHDPVPHISVLLAEVVEALHPVQGSVFIDATFGAGGYSRALLDAGARRVIGIDRDPSALAIGAGLARMSGGRLTLVEAAFDEIEDIARDVGAEPDGVVLDVGVSSMQLDDPDRGFSFLRDGPLDMRMGRDGPSAADIVNERREEEIADVLFHFGEERAARRIARAIVSARQLKPITTTLGLAEIVSGCLPRPRPGQIHPATRSFQALRIAVNDELGQLARTLAAAERVLKPGGRLAVVTFHSLEDRIVKRFFAQGSGRVGQGSRHLPMQDMPDPRWELLGGAIEPGEAEVAGNPRARSAKLRAARRTTASPVAPDGAALGVPLVPFGAARTTAPDRRRRRK